MSTEEEMPQWAQALIDRVEGLTAKMEKTFPEPEKKKPDFSALKSELALNDLLLGKDKK